MTSVHSRPSLWTACWLVVVGALISGAGPPPDLEPAIARSAAIAGCCIEVVIAVHRRSFVKATIHPS